MRVFVAASTVAAAALGGVLGWIGHVITDLLSVTPPTSAAALCGGTVAIAAALRDADVVRLPFPNTRRQVPSAWSRRYRPAMAAGLYGVGLGIGLLTHVQLLAFYAVPLYALATGSVPTGAVVFAIFGFTRSIVVAAVDVRGLSGDEVGAKLDRLRGFAMFGRYLGGLAAAAAGGFLVGGALT